ncbi:hypothetical protein RhiirA4_514861 [Rhizophagus irregularis]|uniref:Uncharacterized protein n=1 Tax=Rhizophagus irregularis TaxID=588596 RepID=A0A2I1HK95_9GLOM|nr:hypothetical protein RhiirA4_514861 [Rhizophagus irregularis]
MGFTDDPEDGKQDNGVPEGLDQNNVSEVQVHLLDSAKTRSSTASRPTYDRSYFRNKILDQYPNLYRECSCENFDYYGITDKTSCGDYICPLCKLGHDDEEIEDNHHMM